MKWIPVSLLFFGAVLAQSEVNDEHRCTDLVHACIYEYGETGERNLELQVGKRWPSVQCDDYKLWFKILEDHPWPTPYWMWSADMDVMLLEESESICRWSPDLTWIDNRGTLKSVGFEWFVKGHYPWGVVGRAELTSVTVPAPPEPRVEDEDAGP